MIYYILLKCKIYLQLKDLLGVVDVGSDYRMDKPLVRACREIIETCRETDDSR